MKKLAILTMTALFAITFTQLQAKEVKESSRETLKTGIENARKEIKTEKKELRKIDNSAVSDLSRDNFYGDFGNVRNLKWTKADYYDVASFKKNGKEAKAFYDYNSNLIGTTSMKTFADLPLNAQKTIKKSYKNYKIGDVIYFADNQDNDTNMILWDTQFDDADNYFVELRSPKRHLIVQVNPDGEVFFFKQL